MVDIHLSWERGIHGRGDHGVCDVFDVPPLHWAHAAGTLSEVCLGWIQSAYIHFNDEPSRKNEVTKGTWGRETTYCEDCWWFPWEEVTY